MTRKECVKRLLTAWLLLKEVRGNYFKLELDEQAFLNNANINLALMAARLETEKEEDQ